MPELHPAISPQKSAPRPNKRLVVPFVALFLCFGAICVLVLADARRATWERAGDAAARLVSAIGADVARNIETLDLSMQAVVDNLNRTEIEQLTPELRHLILFDRSATARHLGSMLVLDEAGNVRMDSRTLNPKSANLADREYFKAHRDSDAVGIFISRPLISRLSGEQIVGVSRRLSHSDGSFAGVVVGSLRLASFQTLFKETSLGAGSHITLARSDGIVLMRWPYKTEYIGLDLRNAKLFDYFPANRSGRFEANAATDGVHRLIAFSQIGNLPLVVGAGQSTAEIYRQWNRYALAIGLMVVTLSIIGLTLALKLFSELNRRSSAEAQLALFAAIDPLTELNNRRQFDSTLAREMKRASRDQSPISLLMIDVDFFKTYNDRHGHQGGDKLLKVVGECIIRSLKRGSDVGARYGGDEFAVLLPGTPLEGAANIADQIRRNFAERCVSAGIDSTGLSIGGACITAPAHDDWSGLIETADNALYRAKALGRNRTELAAPPPEPVKQVA